jgi:hypothetical protein
MSRRTKGRYPFLLKFNRGESFHNQPAHVQSLITVCPVFFFAPARYFYVRFEKKQSYYNSLFKTFRIETHSSLFGGTFFLRPDRSFYFQSLGEKNKKQKFVTRNPGDTMGVSGYGSFFCLWAVRACSAQERVFTEPWATPLTAGAMKIEWGVVYYPTIHHGYMLEKNCHPGRRQPWPLPPPMPFAAVPLEGAR